VNTSGRRAPGAELIWLIAGIVVALLGFDFIARAFYALAAVVVIRWAAIFSARSASTAV
jgi:hypothetical protein